MFRLHQSIESAFIFSTNNDRTLNMFCFIWTTNEIAYNGKRISVCIKCICKYLFIFSNF